jgi:hypothetical protein
MQAIFWAMQGVKLNIVALTFDLKRVDLMNLLKLIQYIRTWGIANMP